jgi:hypothetical protein
MASAAKAIASPVKTRKARTVPAVQASTDYFSSNGYDNSVSGLRVQRLINSAGVSQRFAILIAPFIYGGAS